jgi:hypothetical protein
MQRLIFFLSAITLVGCTPKPPGAPAPHSGMSVRAPFGKTWDAVIDVFAFQNIPIRTLERASGFVAAEVTSVEMVGQGKEHPWADCGRMARGIRGGFTNPIYFQPTDAFYNVRVKGDSVRSTVQVTVNWKSKESIYRCATRGVWESQTEEIIKSRAEGDTSSAQRQVIHPIVSEDAEPSKEGSASLEPVVVRQGASATIGAPSSADARANGAAAFAMGKSLIGNHEWQRAERSFREALKYDGSVAEYHASLGSLLMTLKRWDEAEAEFSAALLLDVDNATYRRQLKAARSKR